MLQWRQEHLLLDSVNALWHTAGFVLGLSIRMHCFLLHLGVHTVSADDANRARMHAENLGHLHPMLLQPDMRGVRSLLQQDQSAERLSDDAAVSSIAPSAASRKMSPSSSPLVAVVGRLWLYSLNPGMGEIC